MKQALQSRSNSCFNSIQIEHIFASLPGAGDLLQPKLLVMFGEDRARFPSPHDIRSLAGTCPVTKQSGNRRRIQFRRVCNHNFRETAQQFAVSSVQQADWAATYFIAKIMPTVV